MLYSTNYSFWKKNERAEYLFLKGANSRDEILAEHGVVEASESFDYFTKTAAAVEIEYREK